MYTAICIYWKEGGEYIDRCVMLHMYTRWWVWDGAVPPPTQSAKLKLRQFLKQKLTIGTYLLKKENVIHNMYEWWLLSRGPSQNVAFVVLVKLLYVHAEVKTCHHFIIF